MKQLIGFVAGILIPGLVLTAGGIPNPALAQTWPSKPIRIVIAQAPGSATDVISRDVKATLAAQGLEVTPGSPAQFAAHIKSEIARFTRIAKAAGIKAE
jgi:tripartite-type tricarboxylate transporter receptor subunit TctC